MRVLEHLLKAVRDAAVFNPEVQVAPACILWPDHDRQWEAVIPRLQAELTELFILGDYTPDKRSGPAIWLRCVIAGKTDDESFPMKHTPIFYLPGVSRQNLRAVESCPDYLKPLAELQYRGVIWSQINAKDWTILAYLKSDQDGLGLDVALDNDAKNAMQLALYRLLDEEMELLKSKRLDKDYFNMLLTGGDPVRDLLQWIDQSDAFQVNRGENEWKAFVEVCKSLLAFNPQKEGALAAAAKLAAHEGSWSAVWERFCEAPKRYPSIPARIRQCKMASLDLFSNQDTHGGWPQWNEQQEKCLHADLQAISNLPAHEARNNLLEILPSPQPPPDGRGSDRLYPPECDCILFVDGLRYDAAKRLVDMLEKIGCTITENQRWAALPSVTGTGKPAVAPLNSACSVSEEPDPSEFQVLTPYQFDKAMKESGWLIIRPKDPVPPPIIAKSSVYSVATPVVNKLWVEFGNLDHEGHDRGWKLAKHIHALLMEIRDRIAALLAAGWKSVRVVTDHGWLLLPGGLPKIDMPACLADSKWGRCASLKPGVSIEERIYPWYWNPNQLFALADGISCFKKNEEYTHGGLSLQECLTLELVVIQVTETGPAVSVEFTDVVWKGLRCTVAVDGGITGLSLDVRMQPGNSLTSVVVGVKPLKGNGTASVVIENEDLEGHEATLVLIDANNGLVAQVATVIGGGGK
jgi:hypothetical protein